MFTDARSGNYSFEIRCTGADCYKAAAYSNKIRTQPNQAYRLTLYTKCAPSNTTRVYIPDVATGYIFQAMNCTGDWAANTVNFTTTATAKDFFFYLFDYYGTAGSWARFDDMVLTYGDGTTPQTMTMYPGSRNSRVGSRAIEVDGVPYLDLGFFDVGYDDLAQAAAMGVNTVHAVYQQPSANCYNTGDPSHLDRMFQLGLNFVPHSTTSASMGSSLHFSGIMQRFAPHRSVIAWMLTDEPDQANIPWSYVPPAMLSAQYNAAKSQTALPLFANFQRAGWAPPAEVSAYTQAVDFWMAEPYGASFYSLKHATDQFNSLQKRPIWLAQDAIAPPLIVPKAYWAIVNGATGIVYFNWEMFKENAPLMAAVQQGFGELRQLQNVIFSPSAEGQVSVSQGLGYMARGTGNSIYVLAVNPETYPVQGKVSMRELVAGQQVRVLFENRTITASAGEFTDTFPGPSRHVYVIDGRVSLAGTLTGKSGPDERRLWRLQVMNTGSAPATAARITGITFTQAGGAICSPAVVAASLPVALGDIAPGASATGDLPINFTGCDNTARFTVNVSFSASNGAATGNMVRNNERK
ncbi:MAG: hypothetical protein K2X03_12945 [Bryobacteraceae bacterium]|nr:hypothetical protein [Bryobacteraceae bacterium]